MNSVLYRWCVLVIVIIEMVINMMVVVDRREMVYEFKLDLIIYDRYIY